jgi:NADH-quinone oxidoreductase subunit J
VRPLKSGYEAILPFLSDPAAVYVVATILGTIALATLLPGAARPRIPRVAGALLFVIAALVLLLNGTVVSAGILTAVVWSLSLVAILGGLAMVTSRKPVYSAIWFALTLFAVGGLFFMDGAQFLGIATVAVYAGAIVVTFLFVLMLAQPEGHTFYDRMSWGKLPRWLASLAGMSMASLIAWSTTKMLPGSASAPVALNEPEHVAALGGVLFSKYLLEIQIAGALLLIALVGAVAMASQKIARIPTQVQQRATSPLGLGVVKRD